MKTTIALGVCALMMCFGASVSWTQKSPRRPAVRSTKKNPKAIKKRPKARPSKARKPTKKAKGKKAKPSKRPTSRAVPKAAKPSPQQLALQALIKQGIKQLKAKKYEDFLRRFISPGDKARIFKQLSLRALAPRFGQHKAGILLAALSYSLKQKPRFNAPKAKATFSLKGISIPTPKKRLVFVKIKGTWYIKD